MTDQEKIIYDILCSDEQPPEGQHWEGFVTNKIVAALAQPKPEPVAVLRRVILGRGQIFWLRSSDELPNETLLYTAPPHREWVGLTEEEITDMLLSMNDQARMSHFQVARAIQQALKDKHDLP